MAFQNFPYTDLHTLNLDWILDTIRKLQEAWNGFQVDWGQDVAEQVDKWLEEHPEATTTVQDGSISIAKLTADLRALAGLYTTPQAYGATGDGNHDDVFAFQAALQSDLPVIVPYADYKLSLTLFTDDSIVVEDRGNYTEKKLIVSRKISPAPLSVISRIRIPMNRDITSTQISGACMAEGHLIVCGYDDNMIYELDPADGSVIQSAVISQLGHANSLTYNALTHKLYVCPMQTAATIVELNRDLTYSRTIVLPDMSITPSQFAWDPYGEIYYAANDAYLYAIQEDFSEAEVVAYNFNQAAEDSSYANERETWSQGCDVYRGQFLSCIWVQGALAAPIWAPCIGRLAIPNWAGGIKACYDTPLGVNEELEDVAVDGDELILVSWVAGSPDNFIMLTRLAPSDVMLSAQPAVEPWTRIGLDYTSNSYVPNLNNAYLHQRGDTAIIRGSIQVNGLPASGSAMIGRTVSYPVFAMDANVIGNAGSVINISVAFNGEITISNPGSSAVTDNFHIAIPCAMR